MPVQRVYFPWNRLGKHRYAINTVGKKNSISKAVFYNTKASFMLEWQTKQAAFSRATDLYWTASQRAEFDLQIKEGHLWPTWCMEKHNSLKDQPSKVDLLPHNINKFYSFFMDLVKLKSIIYFSCWHSRLHYYTSTIKVVLL